MLHNSLWSLFAVFPNGWFWYQILEVEETMARATMANTTTFVSFGLNLNLAWAVPSQWLCFSLSFSDANRHCIGIMCESISGRWSLCTSRYWQPCHGGWRWHHRCISYQLRSDCRWRPGHLLCTKFHFRDVRATLRWPRYLCFICILSWGSRTCRQLFKVFLEDEAGWHDDCRARFPLSERWGL